MTFTDNIWNSGTVVTSPSAWDRVQTHSQLEPKDILSLLPGVHVAGPAAIWLGRANLPDLQMLG